MRIARRMPPGLGVLLAVLLTVPGGFLSCTPEPPPPPRVVDENPPVEDVLEEEPGSSAPETARSVLENTWVAVTEVHLAPGGELTLHRAGERVAYALGSLRLRLRTANGGPGWPVELRQGQAGELPSGTLTLENAGAANAGLVVVTRSAEPLPLDRADGPRLTQVAEDTTRRLLSTPAVRVQRVTLAPGAILPRHGAGCRVIYALGPYDLRYRSPTGDVVEVAFAGGDAHWHTPSLLEIENVGTRPARFLLFAFDT